MATSIHEEQLYKIFNNANDWLKFAEAKNAVLVAFNGAAIAGIMAAYPNDKPDLIVFKGIMIIFFGTSICISLYTFLPVLSRTFNYQKLGDLKFEEEKMKLNCYYFKHHSIINCKQLINLLHHKLGNTSTITSELDLDIADQIINNSEIALSKFKLFSWAAYISFAAVVMGLVVIIVEAFN